MVNQWGSQRIFIWKRIVIGIDANVNLVVKKFNQWQTQTKEETNSRVPIDSNIGQEFGHHIVVFSDQRDSIEGKCHITEIDHEPESIDKYLLDNDLQILKPD